jgi:deoxyadenosine/deoxycytidine kinase
MKSFQIGISGLTGSGKTTLISLMKKRKDLFIVPENVPEELFVKFSISPKTECFNLQNEIVQNRIKEYSKIPKNTSVIIFDRTLAEDREIFFKLHNSLGFLDKFQFNLLNNISFDAELETKGVDLIIFIKSSIRTLEKRLSSIFIPKFLFDSLSLQQSFYKNWLNTIKCPVLIIDNDKITKNNLDQIGSWIIENFDNIIGKDYPAPQSKNVSWENI